MFRVLLVLLIISTTCFAQRSLDSMEPREINRITYIYNTSGRFVKSNDDADFIFKRFHLFVNSNIAESPVFTRRNSIQVSYRDMERNRRTIIMHFVRGETHTAFEVQISIVRNNKRYYEELMSKTLAHYFDTGDFRRDVWSYSETLK